MGLPVFGQRRFLEIGAFLAGDKCRDAASFYPFNEAVERQMTMFASGVRNWLVLVTLVAGTASIAVLPASAQQPSQAEKDAIRSNCRSDFMSKCSSVTPGGIEALQCLKKNEASLSGGCRAAVSAI
jgi:hypothetical protein